MFQCGLPSHHLRIAHVLQTAARESEEVLRATAPYLHILVAYCYPVVHAQVRTPQTWTVRQRRMRLRGVRGPGTAI